MPSNQHRRDVTASCGGDYSASARVPPMVPPQDGNGQVSAAAASAAAADKSSAPQVARRPGAAGNGSSTASPVKTCIGSRSSTLAFHLLVSLTVTVVCANLAMNIFLIRVLQLTRTGMSSVKFSPSSGIWLRDQAIFADLLRTARLSHVNYNKEQRSEGLLMSSGKDIHIESNNRAGQVNSLSISPSGLEARGDTFEVVGSSPGRGTLFRADRNGIVIAANEVPVTAPNGFVLRGSLQANIVRGSPRHDLKLESPLKEVNVHSAGDVLVESKTEHINVKSVDTLHVTSQDGTIVLSSHKLEIKDLPIAAMRSVRVRRRRTKRSAQTPRQGGVGKARPCKRAVVSRRSSGDDSVDTDSDNSDNDSSSSTPVMEVTTDQGSTKAIQDPTSGAGGSDSGSTSGGMGGGAGGSGSVRSNTHSHSYVDNYDEESYALCSCKNGKLFVVGPDEECQASLAFCSEVTVSNNSNNTESRFRATE